MLAAHCYGMIVKAFVIAWGNSGNMLNPIIYAPQYENDA